MVVSGDIRGMFKPPKSTWNLTGSWLRRLQDVPHMLQGARITVASSIANAAPMQVRGRRPTEGSYAAAARTRAFIYCLTARNEAT